MYLFKIILFFPLEIDHKNDIKKMLNQTKI